jgi:tRNA modification GTPase
MIATKCDMQSRMVRGVKLGISALTGAGLKRLEEELERFAHDRLEIGGEIPALTRERHRQAIAAAVEALDRIQAEPDLPCEVVAEEVRLAQHAVGRIAGRVDVEDVLGEVFGRFCIGK